MIHRTPAWTLPAAAALLFCFAMAAAAAGKGDARLDGSWQIDTSASDNFDARLQRMAEEMRAKRRGRGGGMGSGTDGRVGGPGGSGGAEGANGYGVVPGLADELPPESRDELQERLGETFRPPAKLRIETVGDEIIVRGDAPPERRFRLAETVTRMDSSGTATISTRWSGAALLVDSRYTSRARSQLRYEVDRSGTLLNVTLQYTDVTGGKLQLHSAYHRGTP